MWQTSSSNIGNTGGVNTSQLAQGEVLGFDAEYYDPQSLRHNMFQIKYYGGDSDSVEIIDIANKRLFLKKIKRPASLNPRDLHVGGKVNIFGRDYEIKAYSDAGTANKQGGRREEAFIVTALDGTLPGVFDTIDRHDMQIKRVNAVYQNNQQMVAISAIGPNSNNKLNDEGIKTRQDLDADAKREFFTDSANFCGTLDCSTCCIIQPTAVANDLTGGILEMILSSGYEISGLGMFELSRAEAKEFLEVYENVIPTFEKKVDELCSGPCIAVEVRARDAVATFRQTAGPWDVDMARKLAEDSIRGRFGDVIHCTDLETDAYDECNYFFGNEKASAMLSPLATAN